MKVELLNYTPLEIAIKAIRMCYRSEGKSDSKRIVGEDQLNEDCPESHMEYGQKDKELIKRMVKSSHTSTLEHLSYTYQIENISRVTLAQIVRHRICSFSVESQRYVNQKDSKFITPPKVKVAFANDEELNKVLLDAYDDAFYAYDELIKAGVPKEDARYFLPQGITTNLVMTINARSLRNFLKLRLDNRAQWEIRELAGKIYTLLPKEHKETVFYDFEED